MFCVFTTIVAVAGEQFEVFGVHSDQELSVIKSKLTEKFGKKWRCEDQRDDGGLKIFTCGGFNYFDDNMYYDYTVKGHVLNLAAILMEVVVAMTL